MNPSASTNSQRNAAAIIKKNHKGILLLFPLGTVTVPDLCLAFVGAAWPALSQRPLIGKVTVATLLFLKLQRLSIAWFHYLAPL